MNEFKYLKVEEEGGIVIVKISREKALNALNSDVLSELKEFFSHPKRDFHVVIITGEGKAFVAGADITEMKDMNGDDAEIFSLSGQEAFSAIENYPYPVIAAINGYALGGGLELALSCDIRIASEKAKMGQPEVNLGVIPGFGGTQRLSRTVGKSYAKWLIYTGKTIKAEEAYRIGLVNAVFPPEELIWGAKKLAQEILKKGPFAIKMAKTAINRGAEMPLEEALRFEAHLFSLTFNTNDQKEGMSAFLEKRLANFKGI